MPLPDYTYTHVDKHGRIVIPASMRDELQLQPGEEVALWVKDGQLMVEGVRHSVRRMMGIGRRLMPELGERSIVDEFIAEKRAEAERE